MKDHFNGGMGEQEPPTIVTVDEQIQWGIQYQVWLEKRNKDGSDGDPSKIHEVKRRSILHDLPFWKVLTFIFSFLKSR